MYEIFYLLLGAILLGIILYTQAIRPGVKITASILFLIVAIHYFGLLGWMNQPANILLAGEPPDKCRYNSDCVYKPTKCTPCDCGSPVYKDWERICLFKTIDTEQTMCEQCPEQQPLECAEFKCTVQK